MPSKSRKWLLLALALVVAFLLYRFFRSGQLAESWQAVQKADPRYIVAAVITIYACYFLRALRWRELQKHVGAAPFAPILTMTLAGFSAIYLFSRFGEPVRPVLISRKCRVPLADVFGIYALERFIDMLFAVAMLAVWFLITTVGGNRNSHLEPVRKALGTILALAVVGVVVLIVYMRSHGAAMLGDRLQRWHDASGWRASIARIALGIFRGFKTIRSWRDFVRVLLISLAHWFLVILVYQLVEIGFGDTLASLRLQDSTLVVAATMVGSLVQLPGIGGGPQAAMMGAFSWYQVPRPAAFAAANVIFFITFGVCCLVGAPLLFKEGLSFGELRRMREKEEQEVDADFAAHPHGAPEPAATGNGARSPQPEPD